MKSVRLSGNVRDSLLLSFDDAKVSHRIVLIRFLPLAYYVKQFYPFFAELYTHHKNVSLARYC